VDAKKQNRQPSPSSLSDTAERRRIGRVVRDDRDTASIEWIDAPQDFKRTPLSIESTFPRGGIKPANGYDPYETMTPNRAAPADKRPVKRDLRKLSEWIKQMRELEERKKRGDD
jgi:hypothetical protein